MSWLAKIIIDYHLAYQRRFSDNYAWHWAAWQAFPGRHGKAREYLTRLDYRDKTKMFELLLLAHSQPIRPDWCPEFGWQLTKVHPEFLNYQFYRFDLRANPTRKIAKLDDVGKRTKNGKREALLKPDEQLKWLNRKADQGGFRILESPPLEINPAIVGQFNIRKRNEEGSHFGVQFRGVLQVVKKEVFEQTFYKGIGSAKAFGFGMLLLKPVCIN